MDFIFEAIHTLILNKLSYKSNFARQEKTLKIIFTTAGNKITNVLILTPNNNKILTP